jgi:uncharacterized membrane protein
MLNINYKIMFILILVTSILFAHEGHKKKGQDPKPDTLTIVGKDTIAVNGIPTMATQHSEQTEKQTGNSKVEGKIKEITFEAAFEHIHNKVIHFPIALTVVGFLLMLLGYKNNQYSKTLKLIIPIAALFAIIAVLSGLNQAEPFEETTTFSLVETHEFLGFGVLASLILWSLTFYIKKMKKFTWLFAILSILLVSLAGLYGGVIAH